MKRRTFIAGLGSVAAWSLVARAQQSNLPVIGYLGAQSADDDYKNATVPFLQGLKETGYVEGQNVAIEYRYAENQSDLPALAASCKRSDLPENSSVGSASATPIVALSSGRRRPCRTRHSSRDLAGRRRGR